MMFIPFASANSKLAGSRAASHSGGCGFWSGFGAEVTVGKLQCLPRCSTSPAHSFFSSGTISNTWERPSSGVIPFAMRANSKLKAPREMPSSRRPSE